MKSAILSDIHSNLEALGRVCAHAAALGAERYICLGDCIGYGADPAPTLARLMALPGLVAVRGNHDETLFRDMGREVPAAIQQTILWTRARLTPAQLEFLSHLPLVYREGAETGAPASADAARDTPVSRYIAGGTSPGTAGSRNGGGSTASGSAVEEAGPLAALVPPAQRREPRPRRRGATYAHASAYLPDRWEYILGVEQAAACLQAAGTPLVFIGHVHEPRVFYETSGGNLREFVPIGGAPIPLSPRSRYVINVGSVGQPRDGNNAACYVLYDEAAAEVTFHRVPYDYLAAGRKILAAGLDPFFAARLAWGR
jgi:diadenosine tetraphosphatase ApaH/serine/threonine PP2A family protein phosphatase